MNVHPGLCTAHFFHFLTQLLMINTKIARQTFRRAAQSELVPFADNVLKRIKDVAAYSTLQPLAAQVSVARDLYAVALAAARNRGASEILAKNLSKAELLKQLDLLADGLAALAEGDTQRIVDAGFSPQESTSLRYSNQMPAPVILRATSTGKKGQLRIVINDFIPKVVRSHALQYSLDKGVTWKNGAYNSRRNFVVHKLPHSPEMWLQAMSLGIGDHKSEWSEPTVTAVL